MPSPADVSAIELGDIVHLRAANLLWPSGRPEDSRALIETALAERSSHLLADHLKAVRAVQLATAAHPARVLGFSTGSTCRV